MGESITEYNKWMLKHINSFVGKRIGKILDLGSGSGDFARLIGKDVTCVDNTGDYDKVIKCTAEKFLETNEESFDLILLKEVIHLIDTSPEFFLNLKKSLNINGSVIIITRPEQIDYPLFEEAKSLWKTGDKELIIKRLQEIDMEVNVVYDEFDTNITVNDWKECIRNRVWSTFENFTHEQLEYGIKEIELKEDGDRKIKESFRLIHAKRKIIE